MLDVGTTWLKGYGVLFFLLLGPLFLYGGISEMIPLFWNNDSISVETIDKIRTISFVSIGIILTLTLTPKMAAKLRNFFQSYPKINDY